jgi:hypothetical protein
MQVLQSSKLPRSVGAASCSRSDQYIVGVRIAILLRADHCKVFEAAAIDQVLRNVGGNRIAIRRLRGKRGSVHAHTFSFTYLEHVPRTGPGLLLDLAFLQVR